MTDILEVSRSGFYQYTNRVPSAREQENQRLLEKIVSIHQARQKKPTVLPEFIQL